MKILIVFLVCIIVAESRYRPFEIYEIRETSDAGKHLYINKYGNIGSSYKRQKESPLATLFEPYTLLNRVADEVSENLMRKLKAVLENQQGRNINEKRYVINRSSNLFTSSEYSSSDSFEDKTKNHHYKPGS